MSGTKKGFLKAGSILGIVVASLLMLASVVVFSSIAMVSEEFILDSYSLEPNYNYYEEADGSYWIEYTEDGQEITVSDEEIEIVTDLARTTMIVIGAIFLGFAVAMLVMSIIVLKGANREQSKKGAIITLLVLSALIGNVLIMAFMIVALCLKDKKPTLENINEFTIEQ